MPPAFLSLTGLDGSTSLIDATRIRTFRPTYGSEEPSGATVVYFGNQRQFTPESGDQLAARLHGIIAPATLTTPIGQPVWVDAGKVSSVEPARPGHHENARAVLTVDDREQQVAEDVETAGRILAQAASVA